MSNTIFDLNDSGNLPSINQGMTRLRYEQISSIRSPIGTSFPGGTIEYKWNIASNEWYIPSKSYIRMRIKVSQGDGATQLLSSDGIAPAMNHVAAMFQNGQVLLNNVELSKIDSHMAQISMLNDRMTKEKGWLDGVGTTLQWLDPSLDNRIADVSSDGAKILQQTRLEMGFDAATTTIALAAVGQNTGTATFAAGSVTTAIVAAAFKVGDVLIHGTVRHRVNAVAALVLTLDGIVVTDAAATDPFFNEKLANDSDHKPRKDQFYECIWIPPFSVNKIDTALPVGDYKMRLVPYSGDSYKIRSMESKVAKTVATDFQVNVESMFYYIARMNGPRVDNGTYFLDLDEIQMIPEDISGIDSAQQKTFSVSENTYALTVAFQNQGSGSSTNFSPSKFKIADGEELKLTSLQVDYASQSKPNPQADPNFLTGTDYTSQRYADTQLYTGMYFIEPESLSDWHERGPYYYIPFNKDASDKSTRAIVRFGFASTISPKTAQLLLFVHFKRMAVIEIKDGAVRSVNVQDR